MNNQFSNRAFKYGDGLFETIRLANGKINLLQQHFDRLSKGLNLLQMQDATNGLSFLSFQEIIEQFVKEYSIEEKLTNANLRIRISFFRQEGGLYTPQKNAFDYHIEASPLINPSFQLNTSGLFLGVCTKVRLAIDQLSALKTSSALPYVLAGLEKKERAWDDCFLLNSKERLAESIAANIFVYKKGQLFTPALSEGCVEGVMRGHILYLAQKISIPTIETKFDLSFLEDAEEVFLTNAIQGISWVERVDGLDNLFGNNLSKTLINLLATS